MVQNSENVLPTLRDFFNSEKPMSSGRPYYRNNVSGEEDGFLFHQVLNSSSKTIPQRPTKLGNKSKEKHGFLYQNSKERRRRNISDAEKFSVEQYSSGGFFGVRLNTSGKQQRSAKPLSSERNMEPKLQKSFSARMQMSFMPSRSNQASTNNPTSTSWFSRIKKMANPFSNRNSRRDPLIPPPPPPSGCNNNVSGGEMLGRNKSFRNSSPMYLHAHLSIDYELGMPVFMFSLDRPDDVYMANTWMDDNDSQFVYSFHYIGGRSNRNVGDQRLKMSGVESSLIGQMQVSTQICLEPEPDEDLVESEFVLFDIARARRSNLKNEKLSRQNSFKQGSTSDQTSYSENKVSDGLNEANLWLPRQNSFSRRLIRSLSKHSETSASDCSGASNPWPVSDLHPGLEIAAIVIQDSESLGYMKNSELCKRVMKVIVPTGNHGLPDTENSCPTPLLQRWRSGGGCDCSGWDMGCHLFVLESPELITSHHLLELFIEGGKEEKRAAMVMSLVREGQYEVEFHAKLSALQAFSICVAELHRSEVWRGERSSPFSSGCSSLRELIGMEAPMNRDGRTTVRDVLPSFMPNVTFSPISRV